MPDDLCPVCKGSQWMRVGHNVRACICLKRVMLANYLGPDLSTAPQIQSSPLYALDEHFTTAVVDRTSENVFVKASWPIVRPHLRLALGHRYYVQEGYRYTILTDERILNVYVGNEQYKHRSRANRDDRDAFNGLKDLMEGPDLAIVRLNFIGHKNIAAPGALKQALMIREVARKPTWVIQNPQHPTPVSWNDEVAAYVMEHFDVVDLRKAGVQLPPEPAPTMEVEEHQTKQASTRHTPPASSRNEELMPTHDDDPTGELRVGSRKPGKPRPWKKRREGNEGGGGDMPPV